MSVADLTILLLLSLMKMRIWLWIGLFLLDFFLGCCYELDMNTKIKNFLVKLVVAVLVAVGSVLTTLTVSSCGSTWKLDADFKLERDSPSSEVSMVFNAYSIKDMIDGTFGDILLARSDERCKRTFLDQVARRNRQLKEQGFPEVNLNEYQLWKIGTFDDSSGRFADNGMMEHIPLV